jgi:hypothetical protein
MSTTDIEMSLSLTDSELHQLDLLRRTGYAVTIEEVAAKLIMAGIEDLIAAGVIQRPRSISRRRRREP